MQLVDTHCHIQSVGADSGERTTMDLWAKADGLTADTVISNAVEAGVTKMVCVGCDLEDSKLAIDFAQNHPECFASIGVHPHEAQHYAGKPELLREFAALVESNKVVAIGECGFDFYYNHSPKEAQDEVLKFQLDLAQKHDLPVIFHVREAFDDFWPVLDAYKGMKGVLHSFTDSRANLDEAIERGLFIGMNGIATFLKDQTQLEVYKQIPLQNLLLETDAPFLTPTPYRGTINEPKHVGVIADFVAKLRGESLKKVAAATTQNAHTLFGI
ncbi:MAG TPA: TatD family hydrolase [Patescibacteria group bacterium]|nr:TatD family hydrolase [Patescibacteria group bacterium]